VLLLGVILFVRVLNLYSYLSFGVLWGMAGSVSFAVMSLLNRRFASSYEGSVIAFYEQGIAALVLLPMLLFYRPAVSAKDWGLLILLGVLFTGVAHSLFIGGMKHVRAQTAGIIASLESLYGIISAALILGEIPSLRELVGGAVILGTAAYSTLRSSKEG
ncbi:DMT family transporter, partial [Cloacibacillus porcorum]